MHFFITIIKVTFNRFMPLHFHLNESKIVSTSLVVRWLWFVSKPIFSLPSHQSIIIRLALCPRLYGCRKTVVVLPPPVQHEWAFVVICALALFVSPVNGTHTISQSDVIAFDYCDWVRVEKVFSLIIVRDRCCYLARLYKRVYHQSTVIRSCKSRHSIYLLTITESHGSFGGQHRFVIMSETRPGSCSVVEMRALHDI